MNIDIRARYGPLPCPLSAGHYPFDMSRQEIISETVSSHTPLSAQSSAQPSAQSSSSNDNRLPLEAGRIKSVPAVISGVMHDWTEAGKETLLSAASVGKGLMEGNAVRISLDQVDHII